MVALELLAAEGPNHVTFAALATAARPLAPLVDGAGFLSPKAKFRARRRLEAWEYGSGLDWVYDEEKYGKRE